MNENELQQVVEEGEGYKIEFKESLANLDKELVAFANSSGGRIFVGISDDKEIKGVRIQISSNHRSRILPIIASLLLKSYSMSWEMFCWLLSGRGKISPINVLQDFTHEWGRMPRNLIGMGLLNYSNQRERSGLMNWLIQDLIMIHILTFKSLTVF